MSMNTAHADHGVLIHRGECIILFSDNVSVDFYGNETHDLKGTKHGRMYLTTHRLIFNSKNNNDILRSFSFPFIALEDVTVEQPMFGANYIKGKVRAQPNGNFIGEVKFKLTFKSGGAIEFGTAMLKAAHLANRHTVPGASPPPYSPPTGPWYAAPPPAYAPPQDGYYGWVPPYSAFPDQPPPNSVFVSNNPPPYPGVQGTYTNQPDPMMGLQREDAKAMEAARSAYYDPNRPQTAYVPPPYDQPPTYQESLSKKEN
ncbi:WW domain-binding protein 2 isoform X2 [Pectinophora gossypiella]|uniref:WW domain-binding protein 2 isoform X2 n=1 Tax=Pectinophora gossypiella TaxID=13191 RepID=UPI00214E3907|nr:WW domain-binding protein 2 isoform X2 [Pectinophora gossypiella]